MTENREKRENLSKRNLNHSLLKKLKKSSLIKAISSFLNDAIVEIQQEEMKNKNKIEIRKQIYNTQKKKENQFSLYSVFQEEEEFTLKTKTKKEIVNNNKKEMELSLEEFFYKVVKSFNCEKSSIIICFILIDRLISQDKKILNFQTIKRLFLVCLILSMKVNEDFIYSMKIFSELTNLPEKVIAELELSVCLILNFKLFVSENEFINYLKNFLMLF